MEESPNWRGSCMAHGIVIAQTTSDDGEGLPGATPRLHVAVIPCRWGASRFPGKPLARLGDKPLLWHVHQRCLEANFSTEPSWRPTTNASNAAHWHRLHPYRRAPAPTASQRSPSACRPTRTSMSKATSRSSHRQQSTPSPRPLEHLPPGTLAVNAFTELTDVADILNHNVVKVVIARLHRLSSQMLSESALPAPTGGLGSPRTAGRTTSLPAGPSNRPLRALCWHSEGPDPALLC